MKKVYRIQGTYREKNDFADSEVEE